jgi:hypothetical protein
MGMGTVCVDLEAGVRELAVFSLQLAVLKLLTAYFFLPTKF